MTYSRMNAASRQGLVCAVVLGFLGLLGPIEGAWALGVELTADQREVARGESVTLRWASSDAEFCRARGSWEGVQSEQGTFRSPPLTADKYWFGIMCRRGDTKVRDALIVRVRDGGGSSGGDGGSEELSVTLDASPQQIRRGESSTLSWSSQGATGCQASGDWSGSRSRSGTWGTGSLTRSGTYRLSCGNGSQTAVSSVSVEVGEVPVVRWQPPTRNEDGSNLTNLAGYWLYFGRNSRNYAGRVRIFGDSNTQYRLNELDSGDYYVALTAINTAGEESGYSNEIRVAVP